MIRFITGLVLGRTAPDIQLLAASEKSKLQALFETIWFRTKIQLRQQPSYLKCPDLSATMTDLSHAKKKSISSDTYANM